MSSSPPIRWVSRQELAWNEHAAFEAALDLLEKEPLAALSPEQRLAHLAFHAARSLERDRDAFFASTRAPLLRETLAAFDKLGATSHSSCLRAFLSGDLASSRAPLAPLTPPLRRYIDAFEPYFVRELRPNCTA